MNVGRASWVLRSIEIYGLAQPGPLGIANAGGKDAVGRSWKVLSDYLRKMHGYDRFLLTLEKRWAAFRICAGLDPRSGFNDPRRHLEGCGM